MNEFTWISLNFSPVITNLSATWVEFKTKGYHSLSYRTDRVDSSHLEHWE